MHHTIDYGHLEGQAKIDKAIADIKFYLGEEKYKELSRVWKKEAEDNKGPIPFTRFRNLLEIFLGIDGYPAIAWAKTLGPEIVKGIPE
jgi:hypothetical protein